MQLEKDIEEKLRNKIIDLGGKCLKWVCPGWRGVPDRMILLPGGRIHFVEMKKPKGGRYSPMQDKWQEWLTKLGFSYWRIKNEEELQNFEKTINESSETL